MTDGASLAYGAANFSLEELYEEAPCGYLSLLADGTVAQINRTLLRSLGYDADTVLGRGIDALLAPGSRLYRATKWWPQLELQGHVREVSADLLHADGSRRAVLINATMKRSASGLPTAVRASVFDATDRRRYERELVVARDVEIAARRTAELLLGISRSLADALLPGAVASILLDEFAGLLGADHGTLHVAGRPFATTAEERSSFAEATSHALEVPLLVGDQTVGQLSFALSAAYSPTASDQVLLETCRALGAQALARSLLYAEASTRSEQQAAIANFSAQSLGIASIAALIDAAATAVRTTLKTDAVVIIENKTPRVVPATPLERDPDLEVLIGDSQQSFGVLRVGRTPGWRFADADMSFLTGVADVLWRSIERCRQEMILQHQATHDSLTQLPNRMSLHQRIRDEAARARRSGNTFAMCLLDLDDFKLVNDALGHGVGNQLLVAVGARLSQCVRATDMVARLGGDEFVVLSGDLRDQAKPEALAERLAEALRMPFELEGSTHVVQASIGVVTGGGSSSPESLLGDADVAMYSAKARGRGGLSLFGEPMRKEFEERLWIETELRLALRNGDLTVFYQPLVATATGRLAGFEALVRWRHPVRGLIPPDDFIPVAEATGMVDELGRQVLTTACKQLVNWRADGLVGHDVSVAVNVSGRQVSRADFAAEVAGVLTATGLAETPHLLGLEVTETVLMEATDSPAVTLARLSALGVELLLDDFGTGTSSLARLKRFPMTTLKIDRAFVSGVGHAECDDSAIVAAIVAMAGALGLKVVAEGVETDEQLDYLRALDCQLVQGYLFSRPLPPEEVAAFITRAVDRYSVG